MVSTHLDKGLPIRKSFAKFPEILEVPNLIQVQLESYRWFCEQGIKELLQEISPIKDFTGTRLELHFLGYEFRHPKHDIAQCLSRDLTYARPLYFRVRLQGREKPEPVEQWIYMGEFPLMTPQGTFIINGAERVVVTQLLRSPGIYFTLEKDPTTGRQLAGANLIPERGGWLEFETSSRDVLFIKLDGKRRVPLTAILQAIDYDKYNREQLLEIFREVDKGEHRYIESTLSWADKEAEGITNQEKALTYTYNKLRPGDPVNLDNARTLLYNLFFNPQRYNLGKVGRYRLNRRLGFNDPDNEDKSLTPEDLAEITKHLVMVNNGEELPDDIDHLGSRRARTVGELLQNQFRLGLIRLERLIKERMSIVDPKKATPLSSIINNRPLSSAIREFFGTSQLSQFMDQTNPLAALTHKRRLSAMGPGGLSRERAGFEVRDVHHSHYGRICPIETPEGPNIGLITSLATYSRVNRLGFIETPYRKVIKELDNTNRELIGRRLTRPVINEKGEIIAEAGGIITGKLFSQISNLPPQKIAIAPYASQQIEYLTADIEERYNIAQANAKLNEKGEFLEERVEARRGNRYFFEPPDGIDYMDVSSKQIVSVSTSLIPFLEHDDANRALMGSNMQRQAVPLLRPQAPIVATGMEKVVARDSGEAIFATRDGVVTSVTANHIIMETEEGEDFYPLIKFARTNQGTCTTQRPLVSKGDRVVAGQLLADSSATEQGELALGQNLLVAFMSWEGYNFEDAIVISESLVKDDRLTSIHIERYEAEARETKLGPEDITRDIPNVGEEALKDLDENGIVRIGAEVGPGNILVGKITPKGETELTAEERLLRTIFGEKASEVKDTSLRVPHGEGGRVIGVSVFTRDEYPELAPGIIKIVRVWVAQRRKITVGDKLAGRHGNKGVISKILPEEDMPFLPDGRPIELILNPIGVPSRMNLGQILETHLGGAAYTLGWKVLCPVFQGASSEEIEDALAQAWIAQRAGAVNLDDQQPVMDWERAKEWVNRQGYDGEKVFKEKPRGEAKRVCLSLWLQDQGIESKGLKEREMREKVAELQRRGIYPPILGKMVLRDGRTGEPFDQPITVGHIYMMKLIHLVEDKIHARSTGPYSLITQQPLGGKAQFGGQRFGEMEVWALEAYGVAHTLQELLTVKSDDIEGRAKTYEALVKGEDVLQPGVPESFKVLSQELKSLGLAVEVFTEAEERVPLAEEEYEVPKLDF